MTRITLVLAIATAALAIVVAPAAAGGTLTGKVGPGFTISLKDANGKAVKTLRHGSYTIKISDKAPNHNFHLTGPGGVNMKTSVPFKGTKTWKVKLVKGTYKFKCDPHASTMHGSFKVT